MFTDTTITLLEKLFDVVNINKLSNSDKNIIRDKGFLIRNDELIVHHFDTNTYKSINIEDQSRKLFNVSIIGMRYNDYRSNWRVLRGVHVLELVNIDRKQIGQKSQLFHDKDNKVDSAAIALGIPGCIYGYLPEQNQGNEVLKKLVMLDSNIFNIDVEYINTVSINSGNSATAKVTVHVSLNVDWIRNQ